MDWKIHFDLNILYVEATYIVCNCPFITFLQTGHAHEWLKIKDIKYLKVEGD